MSEAPKFDFSQMHDLMHPFLGSVCPTLPGGRFRHARLWWEYRALDGIADKTIGALRRRLLCPRGKHEWVSVYDHVPEDLSEEPSWEVCQWCDVRTS